MGDVCGNRPQRMAAWPLVLPVMLGISAASWSADIHLRDSVRVDRQVVRLGDIAEIRARQEKAAHRLASLELLPAPAAGARRFLHVRAVRDLLHERGENLLQHRFSGASQVRIVSQRAAARSRLAGPASERSAQELRQRVVQAVDEYLTQRAPSQGPWDIELTLDDDQLRQLPVDRGAWHIRGGSAPWTGQQSFVLGQARDGADDREIVIRAQVRMVPSVVVTKTRIARGAIIRASDVQLVPSDAGVRHAAGDLPRTLNEVVGKEATRAVGLGAVLDRAAVRRPVLVHRNEVVTVYARTAGIVARTNARAREDGSRGDLILVESLEDRKTFHARVTGLAEVDVFAQASRAEAAP